MQLKGKAAIDVVCNPLGKSGGSAIQQVLIIAFGSLATSTPYLAVVLLGIVLLWLKAAASLDKQFAALQEEQQLTKLAEARDVSSGSSKKFKWVSSINSQTGLMEGSYVPLGDGESVTASMDVVEAASAEEAAAISAEARAALVVERQPQRRACGRAPARGSSSSSSSSSSSPASSPCLPPLPGVPAAAAAAPSALFLLFF